MNRWTREALASGQVMEVGPDQPSALQLESGTSQFQRRRPEFRERMSRGDLR